MVCLIKPQFEAGREKVGKKGVVREKSTHLEVIRMVMDFARSIGFELLNLDFSPIKGPEGNIEYLLYLQNHGDTGLAKDGPQEADAGAAAAVTGAQKEETAGVSRGDETSAAGTMPDPKTVVEMAHRSL